MEPFEPAAIDCQACGACCHYSAEWPLFTLESEEELARIPAVLVNADDTGMRCIDGRCLALTGEIGRFTACAIYDRRLHVCDECQPGDEACQMARARHGLA